MKVDEIATEAIGIDDCEARKRFIERSCGDDEALRERVNALVDALAQADADSFLASGLFAAGEKKPVETQSPRRSDGDDESTQQRFRLLSKHAVGGLGEVWMAWDRQLAREVALKQMRPEWSDNANAVGRFRREAEITGYLEHPGVVPIYSLGDDESGSPFYAMQFIRGRTLEQVIAEKTLQHKQRDQWYPPGELRELLDHFVDVCQTIDYAHSKQVVHRDLKPANIMLGAYGQTLVVDWGLAKRIDLAGYGADGVLDETLDPMDFTLPSSGESDSSVEETRQGTTMGTPRFMSPEQAAGQIDRIGPSADVYGLGATLYYILTCQAPHQGDSDLKSTLERIIQGNFDPPTNIAREVPRPLQAIVLKAMATKMDQRYVSAGDMADDVRRYLADQPVSVFQDPPLERLLRFTRTHRAITAAGSVAVILLVLSSIIALGVRQEMNQRSLNRQREKQASEAEIKLQTTTRQLEAEAASRAAIAQADEALRSSRFDDAAALYSVAIDRMDQIKAFDLERQSLLAKKQRLEKLGHSSKLFRQAEDFDHLARNIEAAILFQDALEVLGVWRSRTWWNELPDDDLSPEQRERLAQRVYHALTDLNSIYLARMVSEMNERKGGSPSAMRLFMSKIRTNRGVPEAEACLALTDRIQSFRPGQAATWLGSIAAARVDRGSIVKPAGLGPPTNPADGEQMAIFSLIASVNADYRNWFDDYGATFLEKRDEPPTVRNLRVAQECLRRVSDDQPDNFWLRLTFAQSLYLFAQHARQNGDDDRAIEYLELSRSTYGQCIALRPQSPFGYADRSTVALRQATLMRSRADAKPTQLRRANQLLQISLRDANQAKRLAPDSYWVYWHVGATAVELGQTDVAFESFFRAVEMGFEVATDQDTEIVRLDDLRGRERAIKFANQDAQRLETATVPDSAASRQAALIAALDYSRQAYRSAQRWARKAIQLDPQNGRALRFAGWCAIQAEDWPTAQVTLQKAIDVSPEDTISLIGAATVSAELERRSRGSDATYETADALLRRAVATRSVPHQRSSAWLGLAKHALYRLDLDAARKAISEARKLNLACDVGQFVALTRSEAIARVRNARESKSESESKRFIEQAKQLKTFSDFVSQFPVASVKQIIEDAPDAPPRALPIFCSDFEVPFERHWLLQSETQTNDASAFASSPPLSRVTGQGRGESTSLLIKRPEENRPTRTWTLSQEVPVTSGHRYRLSIFSRCSSDNANKITISATSGPDQLTQAFINSTGDDWTETSAEFNIDPMSPEIQRLEIQLEIPDPGDSEIHLDDLSVTLVE